MSEMLGPIGMWLHGGIGWLMWFVHVGLPHLRQIGPPAGYWK